MKTEAPELITFINQPAKEEKEYPYRYEVKAAGSQKLKAIESTIAPGQNDTHLGKLITEIIDDALRFRPEGSKGPWIECPN